MVVCMRCDAQTVLAALVYDSVEDSLMLGAALCGESSDGPHGVSGVHYAVGSRRNCQGLDAGRFFKGDIAEVLVFNSSLNATQLKVRVGPTRRLDVDIKHPPKHVNCCASLVTLYTSSHCAFDSW